MANLLRGDISVTLFGSQYTLRPDIQSICEIEDACEGSDSIASMFMRQMKGVVTFKMVGTVLYGCLKAQGVDKYSLQAILEEVKRQGIPAFVTPVGKLLVRMINPDEAKVEVKAVAEEKKSESPDTASTG